MASASFSTSSQALLLKEEETLRSGRIADKGASFADMALSKSKEILPARRAYMSK